MNVLLHVCCAPCMIWPLESLRSKGHTVSGLFYNPNIHALGEYTMRKDAAASYAVRMQAPLRVPDYEPGDYFHAVHLHETAPQRCTRCWSLRLRATARAAKAGKFDAFTTTLLVSPYQDHEALTCLGQEIARAEGCAFYYEDFRPGFRKAQDTARALGIYRQKYCGCLYSEIEKSLKKKA